MSSPTHRAAPIARTLSRGEPSYPVELERLPDPPQCLRTRGAWPSWSRAVAIVGTRAPTERGLHVARALARELAQAGCVIVSGGAAGIDRAAHLGALDASAPTVVVHAAGLACPFPAENVPLFARIVATGGLELSEQEDAVSPRSWLFLARNRLVAALARVVVVVEAPARSGALSTAAHARGLDVPVLAVPRVPEVGEALGSNALIRAGAGVCMSASDVLRVVEGTPPLPFASGVTRARRERRRQARPAVAAPLRGALGGLEGSIVQAIEDGATDLDVIVARLSAEGGVAVATVLAALASLELAGIVAQGPAGRLEVIG
ncbi:MAG: DNA-protecting protein DprA [Sandaracinaceae bacterium]|nr:DNA-protecting protein DprA [Sandaracinaceae bacterium]